MNIKLAQSRLRLYNKIMSSAAKTVRFIAKCVACNCATSGLSAGQDMRRAKGDPQRGGSVYTHERTGCIVLDCRKCGTPRMAKLVRGIYSAKHECSAKCLSSTGSVCECSCAGKNHGASYAAE